MSISLEKDASWMKDGQSAAASQFSLDAKIYVRNVIFRDVVVETSHRLIMESVTKMRQQLRQDGKDAFMNFFRSIASAIRQADVDSIYRGMRLGQAEEIQAWQNLCDDTVLHVVARFVLWKRMIPIERQVDEFMKL